MRSRTPRRSSRGLARTKADTTFSISPSELIERKTRPFEPETFHDRYTEALRHLVEMHQRHEKPLEIDEERAGGYGRQGHRPRRGSEALSPSGGDIVERLAKADGRKGGAWKAAPAKKQPARKKAS